jgi:hypothetical protein
MRYRLIDIKGLTGGPAYTKHPLKRRIIKSMPASQVPGYLKDPTDLPDDHLLYTGVQF